jgi:hypothetical protein
VAIETRCILCDRATGDRSLGAIVRTGNSVAPDAAVVCRRCAALPVQEQARRRDAAMARMLRARL